MTTTPLSLGPFELYEVRGTGGMARVWRGRHRGEDLPVAVKVLSPGAGDEINEEIRAVARLNHPGVVRVLDLGVVTAEEERESQAALPAGATYFVMELAEGTLVGRERELSSFEELRSILAQVLAALAHAHGRGVTHRDVKPENILRWSTSNGDVLKLSDFGLAYAHRRSDPGGESKRAEAYGTPSFMAPEQVRGQLRDQGPWTDLYALGCVVHWLIHGEAPFEGRSPEEILRAQRDEAVSFPRPAFPVPREFAAWTEGLLRKSPWERYRIAADALYDLRRMELAGSGPAPAAPVGSLEDETEFVEEAVYPVEVRPMVEDWRAVEEPLRGMDLEGVGLGLYHLRGVPLVGREEERDQIWEELREVAGRQAPRGILIQGARGVGKSRLAEWAAETAAETGAAVVIQGGHEEVQGLTGGIPAMLARLLGCQGLSREETLQRLLEVVAAARRGRLDEGDCQILADALVPQERPERRGERRDQVHRVYVRLLEELCVKRPVVMIVDDLQWGADTEEFLEFLFREPRSRPLPMLILGTAPEDYDLPEAVAGGFQGMALSPLTDDEHRRLVEQLLGLSPELSQEVHQRTRGNPLFVLQVVGSWVEQRALEASTGGFRLRSSAPRGLPDVLQEVLRDWVIRLTGTYPGEEGEVLRALELAAVLGKEVRRREWEALCAASAISIPDGLVDDLAARHLVRQRDGGRDAGMEFFSGALRETLQEMAREEGVWEEDNARCARTLQELYGSKPSPAALRIGHHRIAARDWEGAHQPLLDAARYAGRTGRMAESHRLFGIRERVLDRLGLHDRDHRRVEGWLYRVAVYIRQEQFEEARAVLDRAEAGLEGAGQTPLWGRLFYERGVVAQLQGDPEEADRLAAKAAGVYEKSQDVEGLAEANYLRAQAAYWRGDRELFRRCMEAALGGYEEIGDLRSCAKCHMALADEVVRSEGLAAGVAMIEEAVRVFRRFGDTYAVTMALSNMGDLYRQAGSLKEAMEVYQEGGEVMKRAGLNVANLSLNLSCVLLAEHRFEEAEAVLTPLLERLQAERRRGILAVAQITLLPCLVVRGQWERFDDLVAEVDQVLPESGIVEEDLAWTFEMIARLARDAGAERRAQWAKEHAEDQRRRLKSRSVP